MPLISACPQTYRWILIPLTALYLALSSVPQAALGQCPTSWDDAGIPIPDPSPAPPAGTPELSISGIVEFIAAHETQNVAQLLAAMPPSMRQNYALVDETRTGLLSSTTHPRLIQFGSDARFMMAIGTDPAEQHREVIDIAQLDENTGLWLFRSLDMGQNPPLLSADDSQCVACHGDPARPILGTYPDWPGFFGPQDDQLTAAQATTLENLRTGVTETDRFHQLDYLSSSYDPGDTFSLPGRVYPYTNTMFNMELGTAVADGAYKRLRRSNFYNGLREEILLRSYCARAVPGFFSTPAFAGYQQLVATLGAEGDALNDLYRLMGVNPDIAFSLHRFAGEAADPGWNVSTDSLFGLVDLLVLAELMDSSPEIQQILASHPDQPGGFSNGCFDTLEDSLRYKRYQGWTLRTEARQAARGVFFDVDLLRSHQGIFDQATTAICDYLMANVEFNDGLFFDGFESGNLNAWSAAGTGR